ncbi:hypothetical protein MPLB_2300038 [Mesorhizobium sp. ORS 3324]|nr:hypothetical protein MPLB_2300038 [Mesorhizobium sp. ORS 3324]
MQASVTWKSKPDYLHRAKGGRNLLLSEVVRRDESQLEQVQRHVRKGREHITRRHQIIAEFKAKGFPTDEAEEMLKNSSRPSAPA